MVLKLKDFFTLVFVYIFLRRPHLMHPIQLLPDANLSITFNLKLVGNVNPVLHPFFETINPGNDSMKILKLVISIL